MSVSTQCRGEAALCPDSCRPAKEPSSLRGRAVQGPRAGKANQPRRKKQSGEECGDSWERLQAGDLTGDQPAAQNTLGAEVSGSLRRTPSRPPRSALGLDGVGAPRQAPAARPRASSQSGGCVGSRANLRDCRPDQAASSGRIFDTLTKAENLQRAFAGGGKGLARGAARPALAKNTRTHRTRTHEHWECRFVDSC